MQTLFNQLSQPLGITLLHSLWQGLIIYTLLRIILLCIPLASAANKYSVALLALTLSVIWPAATLLIELSKQHPLAPVMDAPIAPFDVTPLLYNTPANISNTFSFAINQYMPYLVVLWLVGITLQSARLLWGWRSIYYIKQTTQTDVDLQQKGDRIAQLLQLSQKIKVLLSDAIDVPCIIGYLKPMVIIPTAVITQFSAEQIRSILVHEMAHIRRNDYIVNLLQQFIGILFFFNPFTHLINKIIYIEREHSCDDMVLQFTEQPLIYAQALLQLEQSRNQNTQLALAATGKKYHLLNRIKRIMETKKQIGNIRHILAAALLLLGSMGTIAWLNPEIKDNKITITPANIPNIINAFNDTTHIPKKAIRPKIITTKRSKTIQFNFNDAELDKLGAEVDKHSQAISKYYDSDDFKKIQADIDQKTAELDAYFNRTDVKELQAKQEKLSQEFQSKWGNADEQEVIYMKWLAMFKEWSKYMYTPEYKEADNRLKEKYGIKPLVDPKYPFMKMLDHSNKNYPAYEKELAETAPENVKALRAKMDELNKQRKIYNKSPDEQARELRILADSMRRTFNNPQIKQTELELKKLGDAMRANQNNPKIKKQQQELKAAIEKLKAYTNSPTFKKQMEQLKKIQADNYKHMLKSQKATQPEPIENN